MNFHFHRLLAIIEEKEEQMFDKLHAEYPLLYGRNYDEKDMDERFSSLVKKHEELFNRTDIMIFSAAGRHCLRPPLCEVFV